MRQLLYCSLLGSFMLGAFTVAAQNDGYKAPHYGNTRKEESDFIMNTLGPAIQKTDCRTEDSLLLSTFKAILKINKYGIVDSVYFPNLNVNVSCKEKLKEVFLKMEGWVPGQMNGKNITSKYVFQISCIKWEEQ